ncbi:uncharacterized protein LOC123666209 [Melitaea cinxia]|uniref:uncharacterized protein LOC123666209 n=1 Tax=Melitaea cinxia TaxID=113334 RepID=UPI001E27323A|nr:uncharacterized protein LOC123666209 [Melitaea cinxia]
MNQTNFMKWLKEKLVPNLPPQSLVVMDNAPYHSVKTNKSPTMANSKAELKQWITSRGLAYLPNMLKVELYEIIKEHKEEPIYGVDSYLTLHGHKSLRLPPYQCDLNPIEMIWSVMKKRVAEKNVGRESKNFVHLTEEAFDGITPDIWKKECDHVRRIEEK